MTDPNFLLLYVTDPHRSAAFWADLLGRPPIEESDTFAMLPLRDGVMLGLWKIGGVEPPAQTTGGGAEICFTVGSAAAVDATHAEWTARGLTILQPPTAKIGRAHV
jgi:catechol 2,3-dioxygenase-like lactoylglutathione lyase family enzyme